MKPVAVPAHPPALPFWKSVLVLCWLLGFSYWFYSFTLPNNDHVSRPDIWRQLPFLYLDLIDPPAELTRPESGWKYLPQRADILLCAVLIHAAAWALGQLALRLLQVPLPARSLERTVLAWAAGLSLWSLLTLGLGLAGLLSQPLVAGLLLASLATELVWRFREKTIAPKEPPGEDVSPRQRWLLLGAMAPFVLAMLLGSMLPSFDFDVKEYHLQGPKEHFQAGRIQMLPHNVYTSFPFLTEMLILLGMVLRDDWFRGALVGQAVLMGFAPLTGLALYAAGRRWFHPLVGWFAALVFLTTPWTYRISIIAYAEGGLTCYLFLSLFAVGLCIERLKSGEANRPLLIVAGLLAGSGMACKYPGLVSVVFPLALALAGAAWRRSPKEQRLRLAANSLLWFSLGVAVAIGPWLLKNLVETGNPVYPLAYSIFGGREWAAAMDAKWKAGHSPDHHQLGDLLVKLMDVTAKSDWLSPLLYLFAPLVFLRTDQRRLSLALWAYVGWLFLTWWALTHRIDRFWVPMIPVVALLAGVGIYRLWTSHRLWLRGVTLILLVAGVAFNLIYVTTPLCGYNGYLMDLAAAWKEAQRTAPGIQYLNEHPPQSGNVLCVGEAQVFDATFPLVYNTVFDDSIFQEWVADPNPDIPPAELPLRPTANIRATLERENITLLLVNWQEVLRYRLTYGYTPFVTPRPFRELQERGILGEPRQYDSRPLETMTRQEQQEIRRWAPELIQRIGGKESFITGEVYPVRAVDLPARRASE